MDETTLWLPMLNFFPWMIIELIVFTGCKTSHFIYFVAINMLWSPVFETMYTAYYAIGLLAYVVALISYLPFIVSLLRMAYRDTETRRLIFYRNCWRLWVWTLGIDLWTFLSIEASLDEQLCVTTKFMPDEQGIAERYGLRGIDKQTLVNIC